MQIITVRRGNSQSTHAVRRARTLFVSAAAVLVGVAAVAAPVSASTSAPGAPKSKTAADRHFLAPHPSVSTLAVISPAHTYSVNSTTDSPDANPADSACADTEVVPKCSLRAAVMQSNADGTFDKIVLKATTYTLTIPEAAPAVEDSASGDLDLLDVGGIQIVGAGMNATTVESSAAAADRVLDVGPKNLGVSAEVDQLRIRNGDSQNEQGGGVRVGGSAALTLSHVRVGNNTSGTADGGGIHNENDLWLISCIIDNNSGHDGAGLYNNYLTNVNGTQFEDNTATGDGGGVYNNFPLTMTNSSLAGNKSTGEGGGIFNNDNAQFTSVSVTNNDSNGADGGGVYVEQDYDLTWHGGSVSGNKGGNGAGIYNGQSLSLAGVSITGNIASGDGGGIHNGITTSPTNSTVHMVGGTISGNTATNGAGVYNSTSFVASGVHILNNIAATDGGGIYDNNNDVVLTSSLVNGNKSQGNGGGIFVASGSNVTVAVTGGSLNSNTADADHNGNGDGGGMYTDNYVALRRLTISGNSARNGGGIYGDSSSVVNLNESTLNGNRARAGNGGALLNAETAQLTNDTITANSATGDGGGIYNDGSVQLSLTEVTLNANKADGTGGGLANSSLTSIRSSILSANTAAGSPNNCVNTGPPLSAGYNIDSGNTCAFAFVGDRTNTNPKLGPLAFNGGPTKTEALLTGSPAKNTAGSTCPTSTDQRGSARPRGGACDKGAFEVAS